MAIDENGGRIVRVTYHRTYNLGNYNSLKMGMEIEEYIPEHLLKKGYEENLAEECKEMVLDAIKAELKRLGKVK